MWNKPSDSERIDAVTAWLDAADIAYDLYFHPASPTIELAKRHWRDDGSKHCKNLFFRNHKGNRHYLVCFDWRMALAMLVTLPFVLIAFAMMMKNWKTS